MFSEIWTKVICKPEIGIEFFSNLTEQLIFKTDWKSEVESPLPAGRDVPDMETIATWLLSSLWIITLEILFEPQK
jgi:hypothetical protein